MAFPAASEVDLVLALHDAASGEAPWTAFLGRLASMTGARFAALVCRWPGPASAADIVVAMPGGGSGGGTSGRSALAALLTERMRPERIYTAADLADLAGPGGDPAVGALLDQVEARAVNALTAVVPAARLTLGLFGVSPFDAADGAVLRRLFPYLHHAARTVARARRDRLRAGVTGLLVERVCAGWFLLDRVGTVLDSWLAGPVPAALRQRSASQGGRLALVDAAAEAELAALLDHFAADPERGARALRIGHDPALTLRLAALAPGRIAGLAQPAVLATLHGDRRTGPDLAGLLVDRYGLLPSEARLASALASGDSLARAAGRLGLTLETARNYSKKLFAKTGTSGQPDLVRLILTSGLAEEDGPGTPADRLVADRVSAADSRATA